MIEYLPWVLVFWMFGALLFLVVLLYRALGGPPLAVRKKRVIVRERGSDAEHPASLDEFNDEAFDEAQAMLIDQRLKRSHPELTTAGREKARDEIMEAARNTLGRVGKVQPKE